MTKACISLNADFIFLRGFGRWFFCNRYPKSKDLDLLIRKTEIVTSRTGVTSLVRKKTKLIIIIFLPMPDQGSIFSS